MEKKSIYTRELGAAIAREARSTRRVLHIISGFRDKWGVFSNGRERSIKTFASQREAVSFAKKYAGEKEFEEIVVHTKEGKLKEIISYPRNNQS